MDYRCRLVQSLIQGLFDDAIIFLLKALRLLLLRRLKQQRSLFSKVLVPTYKDFTFGLREEVDHLVIEGYQVTVQIFAPKLLSLRLEGRSQLPDGLLGWLLKEVL